MRALPVLLVLLVACAAPAASVPQPRELVVFAASSLTDPFVEIGPAFGAAHGARVTYNFGASTQLRTQLEQGARADLFASANLQQMELAAKSGVVAGEQPLFAQNRLVVVHAGALRSLEELARPDLKLVITQRDVPVGVYTRDALRKMSADARFGPDFEAKVLANVRSEEANVKQLVAKVQLGEADAAFVYATDRAPGVQAIDLPDPFNTVADYPIALVQDAREEELARAFIQYLLGESGKGILRKHGFIVPTQG